MAGLISLISCLILSTFSAEVPPRVPDKIADRYTPPIQGQQKIEGVIGDRLRINIESRLMNTDLDPMLEAYRKRPGRQNWIGTHLAKYIDAMTDAWVYTGDRRLKPLLDDAIAELLATQLQDGYLGTYAGAKRWQDWDVWTHKYNLLALLKFYRHTGNPTTLEAAVKIGDLLIRTFGEQSGQSNIVVSDWHKGLVSSSVLEPMVQLYRFTGEMRYLNFCRYILRAWDTPEGPKIIPLLMAGRSVNEAGSGQAYPLLSDLVGLVELYRASGDEALLRPVEIAWKRIVDHHLYVTGTASWGEKFHEAGMLRADDQDSENGPGETCVTVGWLQLNAHLLRLTGEARYAEELERSIYNGLLAAQHPKDGNVASFLPLIGRKRFGQVSQGIPGVSCCSSSLPRGFALIPDAAWGRRGNAVAVNLYVPGRAQIAMGAGDSKYLVTLTSETQFPRDGKVVLDVETSSPARFPLALRVPQWCGRFSVVSSGQTFEGRPGEYLMIDRAWKDRTRLVIEMELTTRLLDGGASYPKQVAVARGPQVLALDERFDIGDEISQAALRLGGVRVVDLKTHSGDMPKGWFGTQAYEVPGEIADRVKGRRQTRLLLAPVSDAGQAGTAYRVWLPFDGQ